MAKDISHITTPTKTDDQSLENNIFKTIKCRVHHLLHDDECSSVVQIGATLEKVTGVSRDYIFFGVAGVFFAYLVFGDLAELLCNIVGFAYPAYASYMAIESAGSVDDTQWLTYWTVFASLSLLDFANRMLHSIPLYWLLKCLFLLWLYLPAYNGAEKLYKSAVVPCMKQYAPMIKKIIDEARDKGTAHEHKNSNNSDKETKKIEDNNVKIADEVKKTVGFALSDVIDNEEIANEHAKETTTIVNDKTDPPSEVEEETNDYLHAGVNMIQDAFGFNTQ